MKKLQTQAKIPKKNSITGNSSWVELAENCPKKAWLCKLETHLANDQVVIFDHWILRQVATDEYFQMEVGKTWRLTYKSAWIRYFDEKFNLIFTYFHSKPEFATFGSSSGHNHFSFENCSKELESIMGEVPSSNALVSSCRASSLRPRSSSLPSQSKSEFRSSHRSKVDLSKKGCQGGVSLPHKVGYTNRYRHL